MHDVLAVPADASLKPCTLAGDPRGARCVHGRSRRTCPADLLLRPTVDSWPTYHGDYSGQHHSRLTQITPANVHQMTLAWAFQTNAAQQIKATPILVERRHLPDGAGQPVGDRRAIGPSDLALHLSGQRRVQDRPPRRRRARRSRLPDDARRAPGGARRAHRAGAMERRDRRFTRGYWSTNAPLVIRNHLIVGVSGDFDNLPGILKSFDPETGAAAVDVLQHAAAGHARIDQRRRHRRADVDDRHLRPG